MKTLMKTLHT